MPQILMDAVVDADRAQLYSLFQDYRHRLEWDSYAQKIRYEKGSVTSLRGIACNSAWLNPLRMTVEHVPLLSPSLAAVTMLKGPFFFLRLRGSWYFRSLRSNKTRVAIECQFTSRWRCVSFILDPLLKYWIVKDCCRTLQDFKFAAEETDLIARTEHSAIKKAVTPVEDATTKTRNLPLFPS